MNSPPSEPTFEQALEELQDAVRQLEEGKIGLEESLACYERGVRLLRHCHRLLERAEARIQELMGVDEHGRPLSRPFAPDLAALASEPQPAAKRRRVPESGPALEPSEKDLFGP